MKSIWDDVKLRGWIGDVYLLYFLKNGLVLSDV